VAERLDIDISAGSIKANRDELRLAGLQKHPVGASGCGTGLEGGQHLAREPLAADVFPDEHPLDLGWPPCHSRYAGGAKAPSAHRHGLSIEVADVELPVRWYELSRCERSLIRPSVNLDVELIGRAGQRRNVGMLVRYLLQPQLLRHVPSVGTRPVTLWAQTPLEVE